MTKKEKLNLLRNKNTKNSVSIYIPTHITGDYQANRIRWKNACSKALKLLEDKGVEKTSFLKPAMDLIDNMEFWAHQSKGLAGFYSEDHHSIHHLLNVNEPLITIDETFHLSPLLKETLIEDRLFILAISQQDVRFFEAVKSGIFPVKIDDVVPPNMEAALNLDIDGNSIQSHSAGDASRYHGTDSGQDKENIRLEQFFRMVDKGLLEFIHDEKVPLILASVEEYYPIYKECTNYNHFSSHMIIGNPEYLSPTDIRKQLDPVFKEMHDNRINSFIEYYNDNSKKHLKIVGLSQLSEHAKNKNIDCLLVNQNHWDEMSKERKKNLDEVLFLVHDQGGDILVTNSSQQHDCDTIHAVRRY
jgi:hypothetical protein